MLVKHSDWTHAGAYELFLDDLKVPLALLNDPELSYHRVENEATIDDVYHLVSGFDELAYDGLLPDFSDVFSALLEGRGLAKVAE